MTDNISYDHVHHTVTINGKTYRQSELTIPDAERLAREARS